MASVSGIDQMRRIVVEEAIAWQSVRTEEARQAELRHIETYRRIVEDVNTQVQREEYTPELLQKTAELLKANPEYYTIWNYRRRIYSHEFETLTRRHQEGDIKKEDKEDQILDIIKLDLQFLFPLMLKFPKCYWIWNHRLWLLEQATVRLPPAVARRFWEEELGLVGKMLSRDNRNFHGWGYRRRVVERLESAALDVNTEEKERLQNRSMAKDEFDYTTRMIKSSLSNFSAWHNRSKLILRMLDEQAASDEQRKQLLNDGGKNPDLSTKSMLTAVELNLIHDALCDPADQALWFYHQNLMLTFAPSHSSENMAPNLTDEERLEYLEKELVFVEEMLEDFDDCKWIYQALIDCTLLKSRLQGTLAEEEKQRVKDWLSELKSMDSLRTGRWNDLEKSLPI
ncbi:MAG: hypothetical protein Q9160_004813 [Pyrenula sp. 1 TL-2023]